jgi:DNA-directed RNA polymerase subunit F
MVNTKELNECINEYVYEHRKLEAKYKEAIRLLVKFAKFNESEAEELCENKAMLTRDYWSGGGG